MYNKTCEAFTTCHWNNAGTTFVCLFSGFFQLLTLSVNSLTLASVAWATDPSFIQDSVILSSVNKTLIYLKIDHFSRLRSINYEILLVESFPTIIKTSTNFSLKNDFTYLEFSMKFNNYHIVSLTLGNHLSASLGSPTVPRAHKRHHGLEDLNMTNTTNKLSSLIDR